MCCIISFPYKIRKVIKNISTSVVVYEENRARDLEYRSKGRKNTLNPKKKKKQKKTTTTTTKRKYLKAFRITPNNFIAIN